MNNRQKLTRIIKSLRALNAAAKSPEIAASIMSLSRLAHRWELRGVVEEQVAHNQLRALIASL